MLDPARIGSVTLGVELVGMCGTDLTTFQGERDGAIAAEKISTPLSGK